MGRRRTKEIRAFLLRAVADNLGAPSKLAASRFGITRQGAQKHLMRLVREGLVRSSGQTRARTYSLAPLAEQHHRISITPSLEEHRVWQDHLAGPLSTLPENVLSICHIGFTEMLNNAKDHSEGTKATITLTVNAVKIEISVADDGIGIFRKIKEGLELNDEREAILELSKGKVTTDPTAHTGEGIFFASRMFDEFLILSRGLFFSHEDRGDDWLIEARQPRGPGTTVVMTIDRESDRTATDVYDRFTSDANPDGVPAFAKTHVPVRLLLVGKESLVSRSQAKRLLARFQRFQEVMLNFDAVDSIGQAFADEIFRVFQNAHPEVRIVFVNANGQVTQMIRRAQAGSSLNGA